MGNLCYLLGAYEELPGALAETADSVSILFPWGSLLRAMAAADVANLAGVCKPGATVEFVTAIDLVADAGELSRLGIESWDISATAGRWAAAGFEGVAVTALGTEHTYQTTWWKKIRQRPGRQAIVLRATAPGC